MAYEVHIERMAYGPDGIGHLPDGKTVFVPRTVPGDIVEIELSENQRSFARGDMKRIIEASPDRVRPKSLPDEICGTAPWQQMAYEAQLKAKADTVRGALVHTAHMDAALADRIVQDALASKHTWNYRNKIELAVGSDAQGRLALGFHKEGTSEFIPIDSTQLAHKAIERAPKALQGAIRYAQGNRDLGIFRVGVRNSLATGETEIAIWTKPGPFPRPLFAKTLSQAMKATGIVRVMADPGKARKIKGVEVLDGRGKWGEQMGPYRFATQAPSFFQVNTPQARKLVELVCRELAGHGASTDEYPLEGAYIADLYAGGGTFSIPLAAAGADVVAVEAAGSSVRDLRKNAEANGVDIEVVGGDAARELADLGELDALVVDPPRSGLAESIIGSIAEAAPRILAYVSCDPATWARDVARLQQHGYQLKRAYPVDMFPQTYHVETVSFFEPATGN